MNPSASQVIALRASLRLSQTAFGAILGRSRAYVLRVENGTAIMHPAFWALLQSAKKKAPTFRVGAKIIDLPAKGGAGR